MVRLNDTSGSYVRGSDSVSGRLVALSKQLNESQQGASFDEIVRIYLVRIACMSHHAEELTPPEKILQNII